MKNLIIISALMIIASFSITSCSNNKTSNNEKISQTTKAKYICPMCADVKSDKPGKCPKCKMELEENR